MPAGADILTVEFKTNLLAPARGERFFFRGIVIKPGRTLTFCEARASYIFQRACTSAWASFSKRSAASGLLCLSME